MGGRSWEGQYFNKNDQPVREVYCSASKIETSVHPNRYNFSLKLEEE